MGQETNEQGNDFALSAVPMDQRKSYISLTIVWTGYVFVVTSMMTGGGLIAGLNLKQIILATLLGNIFLSGIACLVCIIASKTGLTFALLTRYSFGNNGSKAASIFVPIVNIGWYTIQAATYGHLIAQVFHLSDIGEGICMAASAVVMGIFAFAGIKAIAILGYVAIPAIVFLSLATTVRSVGVAGGLEQLLQYTPSASKAVATGVTAVIGTWVLSTATCISDIMRYAKSTKAAIGAALTGLLAGNSLMILCGAVSAIAFKESDLTSVLLSMGLVFPSILLMTTNIFTTNAANLYSTSLNLANAFQLERKKLISIILVISALLTLTRPYQIDALFAFLDILGIVVPPLAGIILADYFFVNKGHYTALKDCTFISWNPVTWLTWIISLAAAYIVPFVLPSLTGIVCAVIIYPILMKITRIVVVKTI